VFLSIKRDMLSLILLRKASGKVRGGEIMTEPGKDDLLQQLQQVYTQALGEGNYSSALKALELKMKLLNDQTTKAPAPLNIAELSDEAIQKLIDELTLL
jgi:hypothetical protein